MEHPENLKYTKEHEWILIEGESVTVGITDYAQDSLGDVVYLELPDEGDTITSGEPFGVVESVKAVSDLFAPVTGTVSEVNDALVDGPEDINDDPYGEAWMLKIDLDDVAELDGLMSSADYEAYIAEEA